MIVTSEACLADRGQAETPAEAEPEAELGCVPVEVAFAAPGLAELVGGTLRFDYGL